MKPIYEYLVDNSNDLIDAVENSSKFWVRSQCNHLLITGQYEKSIDGINWEPSTSDSLNKGEKLFIYTEGKPSDINYHGTFDIGGNILSLTRKDFGAEEQLNEKEYNQAFHHSKLMSIDQLDLSHCKLNTYCFAYMFDDCKLLKKVPENLLPATQLAKGCYDSMFYGCNNLTTAPNLPAKITAPSCYLWMFRKCTSLKKSAKMDARVLDEHSCWGMYEDCTSMTTAYDLKATTLGFECCLAMFDGCISLQKAPKLPATQLVEGCYHSMFDGCISLQKAPKLPADRVPDEAYAWMFSKCTSLKLVDISAANFYCGLSDMDYFLNEVSPGGTMYINKDIYPYSWIEKIARTWKVIRK